MLDRADGESLNVACMKLIEAAGLSIELPDFYDDYVEYFRSELDTHIINGDDIYEIIEEEDLSTDDIFEATKNPDGTINFLVQYYNGGCGFNEAIETALQNLDKE